MVAVLHLSVPFPGFITVHFGSPEILPGTLDEMAPSLMSVFSCVFPAVRSQNVCCEKGLLKVPNYTDFHQFHTAVRSNTQNTQNVRFSTTGYKQETKATKNLKASVHQ